jgi:hypothetical protein
LSTPESASRSRYIGVTGTFFDPSFQVAVSLPNRSVSPLVRAGSTRTRIVSERTRMPSRCETFAHCLASEPGTVDVFHSSQCGTVVFWRSGISSCKAGKRSVSSISTRMGS